MKQSLARLTVASFVAATIAIAAACSDSSPAAPWSHDIARGSGGTSSDTAKTRPPTDSSNLPPQPKRLFTLLVHVGTPRLGAADTLETAPIAGATIVVTEDTYTITGSGGHDTLQLIERTVGTATSDANGKAVFPNLDGRMPHEVKALPPTGAQLGPSAITFDAAYSDTITLAFRLRAP